METVTLVIGVAALVIAVAALVQAVRNRRG